MPYRNIEDRRRVSRESMRRSRQKPGGGLSRGGVNPYVNPSPEKRNVNPSFFPPIDFRLKNVQRLMDYLGLTEEELALGTTVALVKPFGNNLIVFKPRTGEILGMIPENNARGLAAVWDYIHKHEADIVLLQAQQAVSESGIGV